MGWFNHQLVDTVDGRTSAPPGMEKKPSKERESP